MSDCTVIGNKSTSYCFNLSSNNFNCTIFSTVFELITCTSSIIPVEYCSILNASVLPFKFVLYCKILSYTFTGVLKGLGTL